MRRFCLKVTRKVTALTFEVGNVPVENAIKREVWKKQSVEVSHHTMARLGARRTFPQALSPTMTNFFLSMIQDEEVGFMTHARQFGSLRVFEVTLCLASGLVPRCEQAEKNVSFMVLLYLNWRLKQPESVETESTNPRHSVVCNVCNELKRSRASKVKLPHVFHVPRTEHTV
jgi:hypothetical protein